MALKIKAKGLIVKIIIYNAIVDALILLFYKKHINSIGEANITHSQILISTHS